MGEESEQHERSVLYKYIFQKWVSRNAPLLPPGEAVVAASVVTTCQPQLIE